MDATLDSRDGRHVDRTASRMAAIARHLFVSPWHCVENHSLLHSTPPPKPTGVSSGFSVSLIECSENSTSHGSLPEGLVNEGNEDNQLRVPVIVGAMVLDVQAMAGSQHRLQRGTTTPGKVHFIHGGVGRNVGECMSVLGVPPFLISVVGDDPAGDTLISYWRSCGLSARGIRRAKGASTPVVSSVLDGEGEITGAVADVSAVEEFLTPSWIQQFVDVIRAAPVVVLDANLSPETLEAACDVANAYGVPVWFEPVSVAKSVRANSFLHKVAFISPNEAELIAMSEALPSCSMELDRVSTVHCLSDKVVSPMIHDVAVFEASSIARQEIPEVRNEAERLKILEVISGLDPHIRRLILFGVKHVVLKIGPLGAVLTRRTSVTSCSLHTACGIEPNVARYSQGEAERGIIHAEESSRWSCKDSVLKMTARADPNGHTCHSCRLSHRRGHSEHLTTDTAACQRTGGGIKSHQGPYRSQIISASAATEAKSTVTDSSKLEYVSSDSGRGSSTTFGFRPEKGATKCGIEMIHFPALSANVVTCSGGGDCLVAGTVAGLTRNLDIRTALANGIVAAKWAIESSGNVPDNIRPGELQESARRVLSASRTICVCRETNCR